MNPLNGSKLFQKLLTVASIAGVSSLIAVPGIAELNRQSNSLNQSGDRAFKLAQTRSYIADASESPNSPTNTQNPGRSSDAPELPINNQNSDDSADSPISPSNNNSPDSSTDSPISPSNNQNPGRSSDSPSAPSNNQNPGGSSDSPTSPTNNQNPGRNPNSPSGENSPTSSLNTRDKNFVLQAAQSGMLEVQLGKLGVQRGSSASVKQHAQQMVKEHTQVNQQLMQLAMQKGMELPTEMSSQNKALIQRLSGLSGTSFDAAYKQAMLDSHNQAIALFQAQSQQGQDAELKAWAAKTLPNLQAHLRMVNQMAGNTIQR